MAFFILGAVFLSKQKKTDTGSLLDIRPDIDYVFNSYLRLHPQVNAFPLPLTQNESASLIWHEAR